MADSIYRLLGPNQNRLVLVVPEDAKVHLGQVSPETAKVLLNNGWRPYIGPAKAERGWVVPDTDPLVRPRPLMVS